MRSLLKCFVAVVATSLFAVSARAEEKGGVVFTILSSSVLSGYVDTTAQWNVGSANTANVPSAYLQWLIGKRQAALNAFIQEYAATRGFWGNPAMLQMRLANYRLVQVSGQSPMPLNPMSGTFLALSGGTYFDASGYAYFDPPSLISGPSGSLLIPDNRVLRLAKGQNLKTLRVVSAPSNSQNSPPPSGATLTIGHSELSQTGVVNIGGSGLSWPPVISFPAGVIVSNFSVLTPRQP